MASLYPEILQGLLRPSSRLRQSGSELDLILLCRKSPNLSEPVSSSTKSHHLQGREEEATKHRAAVELVQCG